MSLAEIKEALPGLNAEERKELARALAELEEGANQAAELKPSDPKFLAAKEAVFSKHRELLRRLAQ